MSLPSNALLVLIPSLSHLSAYHVQTVTLVLFRLILLFHVHPVRHLLSMEFVKHVLKTMNVLVLIKNLSPAKMAMKPKKVSDFVRRS